MKTSCPLPTGRETQAAGAGVGMSKDEREGVVEEPPSSFELVLLGAAPAGWHPELATLASR